MAKILSIVTSPGTHSVSIDRMAEIYAAAFGPGISLESALIRLC